MYYLNIDNNNLIICIPKINLIDMQCVSSTP